MIVLYATPDTVAALERRARGYDRLAFRLRDTSRGRERRSSACAGYLATVPGFTGFSGLPEVRAPGDWPGKADTETFAEFLGVITLLALLSALVLDLEHDDDARRRADRRDRDHAGDRRAPPAGRARLPADGPAARRARHRRRASCSASSLANLLARFFGSTFWAIDVGFGVDVPVVLASVAGRRCSAPALAALPAIRRGVRDRPARGARVDRLRGRRPGRAATALLRAAASCRGRCRSGCAASGAGARRSIATVADRRARRRQPARGARDWRRRRPRARARRGPTISRTSASGRPAASCSTRGRSARSRRRPASPGRSRRSSATSSSPARRRSSGACRATPLFRYRLSDGRWFSAAEERERERVAVIERNLAQRHGRRRRRPRSRSRPSRGRSGSGSSGSPRTSRRTGRCSIVPLTTLRSALGQPTGVSTYWIKTTSPDEAPDRPDDDAARGPADRARLRRRRPRSPTSMERDEIAANRTITTTIAVLGFLIVAMSMVGPRERDHDERARAHARDRHPPLHRRARARRPAHLRDRGRSRSRSPAGCSGSRSATRSTASSSGSSGRSSTSRLPFVFPLWNVGLALVGTVVLALLVLLLPLRRAVRLRPGDALRYA